MMKTRENRGTQANGTERKEVKIMKILFKTMITTIILILSVILGITLMSETTEEKIEKTEKATFVADSYKKYTEAMDLIYSDYSEYYYDELQYMACDSFYNKRAEMLDVNGYDPLLDYTITKMVERFERIYNFEHNIYPFYEENSSLGIYYNMPKEGKSLFGFSHKEEPKSLIAQMMDELETEFVKDHHIERDGNSMYIEPIKDVNKPVAEQKLELVDIKDVNKPVAEQKLELVDIKDVNK